MINGFCCLNCYAQHTIAMQIVNNFLHCNCSTYSYIDYICNINFIQQL